VKVIWSGTVHFATMGGFVCIGDIHGNKAIYGLTAGHVLPPNLAYDEKAHGSFQAESDDEQLSSDSESSDDVHSNISSEEDVYDGGNDELGNRQWSSLGKMAQESYSHRARDRDWAVIEITDIQSRHFNISKTTSRDHYDVASLDGRRNALIWNSPEFHCSISGLPARAVLPCGRKFVDVRILQLPEDECM
jgi:hypothetical protein